jgi:predicted outer membrane repeat protein
VNVEDQATVRIYESRFDRNRAGLGGGVNIYRAIVEIEDSVFLGNRATAQGPGTGFGGAIAAASNDTPADGNVNRRASELTVRRSLLKGRHAGVTTTAQMGGCLAAIGDMARAYGLGVPAQGTLPQNRATVLIEEVIFEGCQAAETPGVSGTGVGGALELGLVHATIRDSLIVGSSGVGPESMGGALRLIVESHGRIERTVFAGNSAHRFGGALYAQGSHLELVDSRFVENEIAPGQNQPVHQSFGAAMFSAPLEGFMGKNIPMTGFVSGTTFSRNIGLPVFDDDRLAGPINDLRYNGNSFYNETFGSAVYRNPIAGGALTAAQLNGVVIQRNGGVASTNKSQVANAALASSPVVATLRAAPSSVLPHGAAGDPPGPTAAYLGYAWSGANAQLNGGPVWGGVGLSAVGPGMHTLTVGGQTRQAFVGDQTPPAEIFMHRFDGGSLNGWSAITQ